MIHQISVFVENRPGRAADVIGLVSERANIRALCMAETSDFGILRLIVSDPEAAMEALRDKGMTVARTEVLAVRLPDHPGGLYQVLDLLRLHDISVEYLYAFITRRDDDACVILRVEETEAAVEVLRAEGMELLRAADVYGL
jgi:hypothetical protein